MTFKLKCDGNFIIRHPSFFMPETHSLLNRTFTADRQLWTVSIYRVMHQAVSFTSMATMYLDKDLLPDISFPSTTWP